MRLQLTALVVLLSSFAAVVRAQQGSSLRARTSLYQDDDATLIDTSVVAGSAAVTEELGVNAHALIDVISTASVDVVSAATHRWHEHRYELEGGAAYADGTTTVSAGYVYSTENDWSSHTVNAGVSRDFFVHDLTLGLGGSFVDNEVGRRGDDHFEESLRVLGGSVNAVVVAGPRDLFSLNYSVSYLDGYQASVYRFARFRSGVNDELVYVPEGEVTPDTRVRHAVTGRYNHALFEDSALRSHARLYRDDWGVSSVTAGTEYIAGFDPLELAFSVRGYYQWGADFYDDVYPRQMRYMTGDRKLSTFSDLFAGPRATLRFQDVGPLDELGVEAKLVGFAFYFTDFDRQPRRYGFLADLGVSGGF